MKKHQGPSATELRLKAELDRVRRELTKHKKDKEDVPAAPRIEGGSDASGEVERLRSHVDELERTRERLSRLYFNQLDENRRRAGKLHDILRVISELNADMDLDALLERIAATIQSSLGFRIVLIRVREPGTDRLRAAAFAGLAPAACAALRAEVVPVPTFASWLKDDFRVSRSYFISHKDEFSRSLPPGYVPDLGPRKEWEWHPQDVLFVPLVDGEGELAGYFSVDDPVDRLVPSQETIELLEIFGSHAVVAMENARLYRQLAQRTRDLEDADHRMQETNRLKGQFVSAISHELRTPLTAIQAYVDTLLATRIEEVPPDRTRHFLQVINEEGQRLSRLIESVLDLSRFDSGHIHAQRQDLDFGMVIEETLWLLRRMAETRQVDLKVECKVADTHLDANRDQMRQLVLHLGSNAIKFTPAGGAVVLRLLGDERNLLLQVEDSGIGIPEDALEKIFDRFYQVDSSLVRRYGGTGLGLAICKSIVEWHGGHIRARSAPGEGSCFTVLLPRHMGPRVIQRHGTGLSTATRDVMRLAVEMVSEVMNAGVVSLMSPEPDGSLVVQAALGLDEAVVRDARVKAGAGVSGWVALNRRPVCVAREEEEGQVSGSGRDTYRTGTFLSVPLEEGDKLLGILNVTDPASRRSFQIEDCNLLVELAESISHALSEALHLEAGQAQIAETTDALRRILDHVRHGRLAAPNRVQLARATAQEMGLPATTIAVIAFAATVHDVGMTLVTPDVERDRRLDDDERARMQRHVEMGSELLERLETMDAVRDIVMCHHEWWDGTGYPRGLSGPEIPVGARVLAVVDAFESMTLGRPHRAPQTPEAALAEIQRLRGTQFDPDAVDAFTRILPGMDLADAEARQSAATS
jgi:signal transduction histidine kinase/response regulator RpfG family c-di-GMP phosphodiesterase